jgi:glucan-binding YG repeat protein
MKRFAHFLLALVMVLSLVPATALAATTRGWDQQGDNWYYYNTDGVMQTGWIQVDGKWYYMASNGVMKTGWIQLSGTWYYLNGSGAMVTGWRQISGKWYYFNGSGAMYMDGVAQIGGKWYCFGPNGDMKTGWQYLPHEDGNSYWYFFDRTNGDMKTGWIKDGGKWYYCNDAMIYGGATQIGGKWYYFGPNGDMKTGWVKARDTSGGTSWFFFDRTNGDMKTGWIKDGGKWYYCDESMYYGGSYRIDGKVYTFDNNGVWVG